MNPIRTDSIQTDWLVSYWKKVLANGGRVLAVTSSGASVKEAQAKAYEAVDRITWDGGFCRRDIGWRALQREGEKR